MSQIVCFDTYAWIEYFNGSPIGVKLAKKYVESDAIIVTPTIVVTELEAKALKGQRSLSEQIKFLLEKGPVIAMDLEIARRAAREKSKHGLHTVDAIIYATALENNCPLATGDKHLTGLENVIDVKTL